MTAKSIFKKPPNYSYIKTFNRFMPMAVAKASGVPTFYGYGPIQKALAMEELNRARAKVKSLLILQEQNNQRNK